jgi:hypothetical protein
MSLTLQAGTPTPSPSATPAPGLPGGLPALPIPVCLTRPVTDAKGKPQTFAVIVPSAQSAGLQVMGFSVRPCAAVSIRPAAYRDDMCRLARGNSAVQRRLETVLGAKPVDLCTSARALGTALDGVVTTTN